MRLKLFPLLVVFTAFAALVGLGTWQVKRAGWKENLLMTIEQNRLVPAVALPQKLNDASAFEYRHVGATGRFMPGHIFLVGPRVLKGVSGHHLYVPFMTDEGTGVMVNRGFVTDEKSAPAISRGKTQVEGITRLYTKRAFTPANDLSRNTWYWADVNEMGRIVGLKNVSPLVIDASGLSEQIDIPNNHAQYAAFWYVLALILPIIAFIRFRQESGEKNASL